VAAVGAAAVVATAVGAADMVVAVAVAAAVVDEAATVVIEAVIAETAGTAGSTDQRIQFAARLLACAAFTLRNTRLAVALSRRGLRVTVFPNLDG
jgi:hypothetical protein